MAQIKQDGERRIIVSKENEIIALNKKGQSIPLIDYIKQSIFDVCIIDGEIVGEKIYAFDLLSLDGIDITNLSCFERIKMLESLEFDKAIEVVETAYSKSDKQKMYDDAIKNNVEGVVFKKKSSEYKAGRPASGGSQLKFKFVKEASFIVKDFTKGKRSVGLELIDADGNKVPMGKVTIPPNKDIPKIGSVVEVRYLYAYKGGSIFQSVYKEQRNDVDVEECLMSQIVYKANQEEEGED